MLTQCYNPDKNKKKTYNTVQDLDRAIDVINDRKRAELEIIDEEIKIIALKENNLNAANSEGMKKKIRSEIQVHKASLSKARINLKNQGLVLEQLEEKRDSLKKMVR